MIETEARLLSCVASKSMNLLQGIKFYGYFSAGRALVGSLIYWMTLRGEGAAGAAGFSQDSPLSICELIVPDVMAVWC